MKPEKGLSNMIPWMQKAWPQVLPRSFHCCNHQESHRCPWQARTKQGATDSVTKATRLKCLALKRSWGGKQRKEKWVEKVPAISKSNDKAVSMTEERGSNLHLLPSLLLEHFGTHPFLFFTRTQHPPLPAPCMKIRGGPKRFYVSQLQWPCKISRINSIPISQTVKLSLWQFKRLP